MPRTKKQKRRSKLKKLEKKLGPLPVVAKPRTRGLAQAVDRIQNFAERGEVIGAVGFRARDSVSPGRGRW